MGVIPNPKMAFIFPISSILALVFPILLKYFPKCEGKSQIKSLILYHLCPQAACLAIGSKVLTLKIPNGKTKISK